MSDYTFDTPQPITLVVKNLGGKVVLRATDDGVTRVNLTGSTADDCTVSQVGDTITVLSPHFDWAGGGWMRNWFRRQRIDMTIDAPAGSDVTLQLGGGETDITGKFGRLEVRPGAGDVRVAEAGERTEVNLGAGNITIDKVTGATHLVSGAGNIRIGEVGGEARLQLGTGDVGIGHVTAPVYVKSGAGNVKVSSVAGDVTVDTSLGSTTIDCISTGRLTYRGTGGDIKVGVLKGTPTWTELSTVVGRVSNALPSVGEPKPGQDHVELRITMVSGAIQLFPV